MRQLVSFQLVAFIDLFSVVLNPKPKPQTSALGRRAQVLVDLRKSMVQNRPFRRLIKSLVRWWGWGFVGVATRDAIEGYFKVPLKEYFNVSSSFEALQVVPQVVLGLLIRPTSSAAPSLSPTCI